MLLDVLLGPPDHRAPVSRAPLAHALRALSPVALHLLFLHVRAAVGRGDAELAAYELLLNGKLLTPRQLVTGCTPHLLQAALLAAVHKPPSSPPVAAGGHSGGGGGVHGDRGVCDGRGGGECAEDERSHACRLLGILHARLAPMPSLQAQLLAPLLRALVPLAPRSTAVQRLIQSTVSRRSGPAHADSDAVDAPDEARADESYGVGGSSVADSGARDAIDAKLPSPRATRRPLLMPCPPPPPPP